MVADAEPLMRAPLDSRGVEDVEITRGSAADVPALEPLWVSVHHTHRTATPELAPRVDDDETWRERKALYEDLFRRPRHLSLPRSSG
jgi:hypothetical protein